MSNLLLPMPALLTTMIVNREPYLNVQVDEALAGKEYRSTWWTAPRTKLRLKFESLRADAGSRQDFQQFASFFARHFAQIDSFLFTDPDDNAVTAHGFGVGDGATTAFQLQRTPGGTVYDLLGGPWATSSTPRTNLALQSEAFDNVAWGKNSTTITANATIAPDGNPTADKVLEVAATAQHWAGAQAFTTVNGTAYCVSYFVKATGRSQFGINDSSSGASAVFDLSTGLVSSGPGLIVACGNGWFRCSIFFTAVGVSTTPAVFLQPAPGSLGPSYLGDVTKGLFLWGGQYETGSTPTQYIPTVASAVQSNPAYWPGLGGFDPIYEVAPGPAISVAGVLKTQGTDYSVAFNGGTLPALSGAITFGAAPASGAALTWTGSYYKRVRFANPSWPVSRIVNSMYEGTMDLITVLP